MPGAHVSYIENVHDVINPPILSYFLFLLVPPSHAFALSLSCSLLQLYVYSSLSPNFRAEERRGRWWVYCITGGGCHAAANEDDGFVELRPSVDFFFFVHYTYSHIYLCIYVPTCI